MFNIVEEESEVDGGSKEALSLKFFQKSRISRISSTIRWKNRGKSLLTPLEVSRLSGESSVLISYFVMHL